jgi:hypothetical protein
MMRYTSTDDLLRSARRAAGTPDVRKAVHDLTLHALRSRALTVEHIACVARTVGEGIESADLAQTVPVRQTHAGAWAGLEDAVDEALLALELAAREFPEGYARLAPGEHEQMLAQVAQMEHSLGARWAHGHNVPPALKSRITSVTEVLRNAAAGEGSSSLGPDAAFGAERVLALVASGVLVGLSEALHDPARKPRGRR